MRHTHPLRVFHRAFTLVELIIALVIIGVLAGIAWMSYNGLQHREKVESTITFARQLDREALVLAAEQNLPLDGIGVNTSMSMNMAPPVGKQPGDPVEAGDTWTLAGHSVRVVATGTYEISAQGVSICYQPNSNAVGSPSSDSAYNEGVCPELLEAGMLPDPEPTPTPTPTATSEPVVVLYAPDPPQNPAVTAGDSEVYLTWEAPASDGGSPLTGYAVEYKESDVDTWRTFAGITGLGLSGTITGLNNGTSYDFRVYASNTIGAGVPTGPVSTCPITIPGTPTGLAATPGDTQVTLEWSAVASTPAAPVTGYRLFVYDTPTEQWLPPVQTMGTTLVVPNLVNGTSYDFKLATYGTAGQSAPSSPVSAIPYTVPGVPTNLSSTAGNDQMTLTWLAPANNGGSEILDYAVEYKTTVNGSWQELSDGVNVNLSAVVTPLVGGTSYDFRVWAVNAAGPGQKTLPLAAAPLVAPPVFTPEGPAGAGQQGAFDRAVFSWGSFTTTNNFTLVNSSGYPAAIYTSGAFSCNSSSFIGGYVHTPLGATITNNCRVQGIWAKNNINTSTTTVQVDDQITSSTGNLNIGNNPLRVGGNVTLGGTLQNSDGKTPAIGGTVLQRQVGIPNPPSYSLPKVVYNNAGWATTSWKSYAASVITANGGTQPKKSNDLCSVSNASWSINGSMVGPAVNTVIDARDCSSLVFNGSAGANQLRLRADLTIYVNSFTNSGTLTVTSYDGTPHTLRIVSPWMLNTQSCTSSGAGSVTFQAGGVSVASNVNLLVYSAGNVTLTNGMNFYGQVYGCQVETSNDTTIHYVPIGMP